jgi:prepilin-type N-terminal cleavage/methylation domain-containing protein/prepilin-type processing-associated H-X9-DG protein
LARRTSLPYRSAFTLIELLVVISIIALLVGILLPALGAARKTAQGLVCQTHMKNLTMGFAVYATDNKEWWPSYALLSSPDPTNLANSWVPGGNIQDVPNYDLTKGEIFPFVEDKKVWTCPSDDFAHLSSGLSYSASHHLYRLRASETKLPPLPGMSQDEPGVAVDVRGAPGKVVVHPWTIKFRSPSQLITLVDEGGPDVNAFTPPVSDPLNAGVNDGLFQNMYSAEPGGNPSNGTADKSKWYHNGSASFGFADGHGELRGETDEEIIGFVRRRNLPNGRLMQYGKLWDPLAEAPLTPLP